MNRLLSIMLAAGSLFAGLIYSESVPVLMSTSDFQENINKIKKTSTLITNKDSKKHSASRKTSQIQNGSIFQLFSGLFIVIISIVVVIWMIKRFSRINYTGQQMVKVLGGVSLGGREKIILVEVGDHQLLIGVAPGRVNLIQKMETPLELSEPGESFQSVIGQRLKGLFQREKGK